MKFIYESFKADCRKSFYTVYWGFNRKFFPAYAERTRQKALSKTRNRTIQSDKDRFFELQKKVWSRTETKAEHTEFFNLMRKHDL